jgi:HD-GYP domain-containing protein (c-di-GMP phosphodiesterase class II)
LSAVITGYPDGLTAEKIPLESRIIAIADVLEALTGERPYRKPMNIEEAVKMMRGMSLDQDILYILCDNIEYFKKVREKVIIDM